MTENCYKLTVGYNVATGRNHWSRGRRGNPISRSTREGDPSEITVFDDANCTDTNSQEIVQYQRAGPPGPLLY